MNIHHTVQYKCSLSKYRGLRGNSYVENADAYVNKHSIVLDEGTLPCITGQRLPHCFESRRENLQTKVDIFFECIAHTFFSPGKLVKKSELVLA